MIDGLKLTLSGAELRRRLEARIADHRTRAAHWTREEKRTPEEQTEDAPLMPEHICSNEAERHLWRAEFLSDIRDHVDNAETYLLGSTDLEFGELLPEPPEWLEQNEYERRHSVGFALERLAKAVERLDFIPSDALRHHLESVEVAGYPAAPTRMPG